MRIALAAALFSLNAFAAGAATSADTVLINGTVLTVDAKDSVSEALAIADGKILAVGKTTSIRKLIGPKTEVIDLKGRAVTPGLIDTHFHMDGTAKLEVDAAYPSVRSIAEVVERVRAKVASVRPGDWVLGRGWDEGKLSERRYIFAADLDAVAPSNPVFISHATGHYAVVNSEALRLAGITRDTPNPPAGTIDKDQAGNPTGVLKEKATALVLKHVPAYSAQQQREGFRHVFRELASEGMTGIKDPGIAPEKWELYREMLRADELTARIFVLWETQGTLENARAVIARSGAITKPYVPALNDGHLIAGGVKLFLDGSGGARTAWMHEDWSRNYTERDAGNVGYPLIEPGEYRKIVAAFHEAGIHIGTHAIGDKAIDWAVDTYAEALRKNPVRGLRHAVIHANIPSDHAIEVMGSLQRLYDAAYPETQPTFMWWIGDIYAGNFGKARDLRLMPYRSYREHQVIWAGGSDYDVTPLPAKDGIWASVARETLQGTHGAHPFGMDQAVDVRTALRSYTVWAAHQIFLDDRVGSLEPGKLADLAVWDRSFYDVPTSEIRKVRCELTMLAGRTVYRASQPAPAP